MKQKVNKTWKVIIVIILIVVFPVLINYCIQIPRFTRVVGKDTDWLAFHGSYVGAIIGASISFYVMYRNLLYYRTMDEYRYKVEWLNDFRKVCVEYVSAFTTNNMFKIVNETKVDVNSAYEHSTAYLNQLIHENNAMSLMTSNTNEEDIKMLSVGLYKKYEQYYILVNDIVKIQLLIIGETKGKTIDCRIEKKQWENEIKDIILKENLIRITNNCLGQGLNVPLFCLALTDRIKAFDSIYKSISDDCKKFITEESLKIENLKLQL